MPSVTIRRQNKQQECIPVGCVPIAAVAATRWQYWGSGRPPIGRPLDADPPPRQTFVGRPIPVDRMTDRRFWKHYLSLRPVTKKTQPPNEPRIFGETQIMNNQNLRRVKVHFYFLPYCKIQSTFLTNCYAIMLFLKSTFKNYASDFFILKWKLFQPKMTWLPAAFHTVTRIFFFFLATRFVVLFRTEFWVKYF